ncbi:MAG: glycoside hydrolase [Gammaproteobacteria bacterium]|nr:glycoside hydrolase [Gammaproteobacteria bacterium]
MNMRQTAIQTSLVMLLLGAPTAAVNAQVPDQNVNVSNLAGTQSEVGIAVDPTNPQNLVAVSNNNADISRLGVWFSTDGGLTWTANFLDENEDGLGAGDSRFDPNVAFDSDGNVYVVYSTTGSDNRLLLARSTNGGQNFNQVTTVTTDAPTASNLHTAMVTTRSDGGAATPDDVLVVWARPQAGGESIEAALSLDAGATFPTINSNINDALQRTFLPWAAVDDMGDFQVVWEVNTGGGAGVIFHDTLDGTTLVDGVDNQVTTVQITDFAAATSKIPAQPDRGLFSVSTIDVDRTTGRIFVSYTDRPNTLSNDTDIYVRTSDDSGATWSARTQINDDVTTTSQFMPHLAMDQTTGFVAVTWYDARNDVANNQQVDVYVSVSKDGGLTWTANQQVTTARSDESNANAAANGNNYGEYFGLIAQDGVAHAAWTDGRAANYTAGTNEDVYTALIFVDVPPICDGNGPHVAECNGPAIALDGSNSIDPDGGPLTFSWAGPFIPSPTSGSTPSVSFPAPPGLKSVDLTVTDDESDSAMCMATVDVQDTLDPNSLVIPADITAECASPAGTAVDIGTATATDLCDPDPDIVNDAPALFPLGPTNVTWTATDDSTNQISAIQTVTIVDTTEPVISCNAPGTIIPPDAPISFTATAIDVCQGDLTPVITKFDCFKFTKKGKRIDKTSSCEVSFAGDTITILDSGGVADHITWTAEATDGSGNTGTVDCEVVVVNPGA